jgi:zinc protease
VSARRPASAPWRRRLAPTLLLAAAVALGATSAGAQPYPTPPPPAPPRPLAIAAPVEARLENGLRVVVARREGVPLVSAELVVLAGSEIDPPRLSGLAAMGASLLTQGTRRRSAPELAAAAEALGGSLDSGAGWHQSTVAITVTTPKLDAALALVAEVAMEPAFAAEEIDRVRTQSLDGLKVAYAEPDTLAALVAERLAYGGGAYGHPARGTPESLPRIRRDDLVGLHRRTFRPDKAVLILAGDIGAEAGLALARTHFAAWGPPEGAASAAPPDPPPGGPMPGPQAAAIDMAKSGQAAVVLALPLPARTGADRSIGAVMNAVLGSGYSSRLNQEIRVKRGLSYSAGSSIDPRREAALLRVAVQTKNESATEVVRLVQAEIDRLIAAPVAAEELAARKLTLIGAFSRSVETTAGLAGAIRGLVVGNRPPAELKTRIESLEAVGPADVQRYAAAQLSPANRRVAVAGDAALFGTTLKEALPGLVTVRQDALDLERADGLSRK